MHGGEAVTSLFHQHMVRTYRALRTHDYLRQGSSFSGPMIADSLRQLLEDEPVVREQPCI